MTELANPFEKMAESLEGLKATIPQVTNATKDLAEEQDKLNKKEEKTNKTRVKTKEEIKKEQDAIKKAKELEQQKADDTAKLLLETEQLRIQAIKDEQQRAIANLEFKHEQELNDLENSKATEEQKNAFKIQAQKTFNTELDAIKTEFRQKEIDAENKAREEKKAKDKEAIQAEIALRQACLVAQLDLIGAVMSGFSQLAGQSKAMALAEIAFNTGSAIAKAISGAMGQPPPATFIAMTASISAVLSGMAQAKSALAQAPAFAMGGIVGGSSFQGDRVLARVNSGEMILNKAQQSTLFGMINNPNMGSSVGFGGRLRGEDIFFSQERSTNRLSRYR